MWVSSGSGLSLLQSRQSQFLFFAALESHKEKMMNMLLQQAANCEALADCLERLPRWRYDHNVVMGRKLPFFVRRGCALGWAIVFDVGNINSVYVQSVRRRDIKNALASAAYEVFGQNSCGLIFSALRPNPSFFEPTSAKALSISRLREYAATLRLRAREEVDAEASLSQQVAAFVARTKQEATEAAAIPEQAA